MTIMMDEIREEPRSLSQTISHNKDKAKVIAEILRDSSMVYVTGSGTSYNASVFLSTLLLKSGVPTFPIQASDLNGAVFSDRFSSPVNIIFSQSGENIDALSSMNFSKSKNIRTIGITNNPESTLARNSHVSIVTMAGNELSVAATKSHTVQLAISILIYDAMNSHLLDKVISNASSLVERVILNDSIVKNLGNKLKDHVVFLGAGLYYPLAMEGALKFKETSGSYAEAYSTREYLHGPIHTLDDQTSVILLRTNENNDNSVIKKISEIGGKAITIGPYDSDITVPQTDSIILALEYLSVIQMLANYRAQFKGEDPDHPRFLSKVVRE